MDPAALETSPRSRLPARAQQVVDAAFELLDEEGADGLSMRRLALGLGITAPALYRYFPDKRTLEDHITYAVLWRLGDESEQQVAIAREDGTHPLRALVHYYRGWALAHPHLYRLVYTTPLDRDRRDPAAELHTIAVLVGACDGDRQLARRLWIYVHGIVMLELDDRLTPESDPEVLLEDGLSRLLV